MGSPRLQRTIGIVFALLISGSMMGGGDTSALGSNPSNNEPSSPNAAVCNGEWHTVPAVDLAKKLGDLNSLNAVAAISSTDVWGVGQFHRFAGTDYDHTLAEHWD